MKKVIYISIGVFLLLVLAAGYVTEQLNPSLIITDFYKFVEKYFGQWSLALSAAGTIILALTLFFNIFENRRREELQNRQAIYALHDEIHWNMRPIITLRYDISERLSYINEHHVKPSEPAPFQLLETRVFDEMRSRGQLHLLESLRMDVVFCYGLIDNYNRDGRFKPKHLELLKTLHERIDKVIRNLETKFKFLPRYVKYEDEDKKIVDKDKISQEKPKKKAGNSNSELRREYFLILAPVYVIGSYYLMQASSKGATLNFLGFSYTLPALPYGEYIKVCLSVFLLIWALFLCYLAFGRIPRSSQNVVYKWVAGFSGIALLFYAYEWIINVIEIIKSGANLWYFYLFYIVGFIVIVALLVYPYVASFKRLVKKIKRS